MSDSGNSFTDPAAKPAIRTTADFVRSPWGDRFLHYRADSEVIKVQQHMADELNVEIKKELFSLGDKPLTEQLQLIDSFERLGIAYHFEREISDALQRIHQMKNTSTNDLFVTSLRFRLLRQHGFKVSCDLFEKFIDSNGNLKETISKDVQGMLSLYHACYVRGNGESILDDALTFTSSKLKLIQDNELSYPLKEDIRHALTKALPRWPRRIESVHYMQIYEQDPFHHETLLKFAKLDFNLLQSSHKQELSELCRWWKRGDMDIKLPLRSRVVEGYLFATRVYYEPEYSLARNFLTKGCQIATTIDDVYDACGTIEELEIFTQAVQRWDKSYLDRLPEDLRECYEVVVLDICEGIGLDLASEGRSQYMYYVKEEIKSLCRTNMIEARWRHERYIPTVDEYTENVIRSSAYIAVMVFSLLGMDSATHHDFEWVCKLPKPVKATCLALKFMGDIAGNKFDKIRGHSSLSIECYMKEYDISYEEACRKLNEKIDEMWKDLYDAMTPPNEISFTLFDKCIYNYTISVASFYDGGEDGYTSINKGTNDNVTKLFINSFPLN